jgi:hypothetical protein
MLANAETTRARSGEEADELTILVGVVVVDALSVYGIMLATGR